MATAIALTTLTLSGWTDVSSTLGTLTTLSSTAEFADFGGSYRGLLKFTNSTSTVSITATIVAGDKPPALRAGMGPIVTRVIAVGETYYFVVDGSRSAQNDAVVRATFSASTDAGALRLYAIRMPRGA